MMVYGTPSNNSMQRAALMLHVESQGRFVPQMPLEMPRLKLRMPHLRVRVPRLRVGKRICGGTPRRNGAAFGGRGSWHVTRDPVRRSRVGAEEME